MRQFVHYFLFAALALCALSAGAEERVTYFVPNAQGSPVAAMDEQGKVIWRENYAPYGERRARSAANKAGNAYTGKPEDQDTGFVYLGARWYDPVTGRFTGVDPQGFTEANPQSFGRYVYANSSPYVYNDPDGELAQFVVAGAIFLAKEGSGIAFEATTGLPAIFSVKGLTKAIAKNGGGNTAAFKVYKEFAEKVDITTTKNTAVFYSGSGNREFAERFARENGKVTLEMTPAGKLLDSQGLFGRGSSLTTSQAFEVWATLSRRYAEEASGVAVGFVKNARLDGVFSTVESAAIRANRRITNFITGGD